MPCSRVHKARVKSEADIGRYLKSPKFQQDSRRLAQHLAGHGGEPSPADLRAIPELAGEELAAMYRPVKRKISVRVDADVLAWLKSGDDGYQTRLNQTLREAMLRARAGGR
jgi:uncharacterized protein (DUF4415 family)